MTKPFVKPKTSQEGYRLVLQHINRTDLAKELGVSKQLLTRWDRIPPRYAAEVADLVHLPIGYIIPELESSVSLLLNRPSEKLLPQLIKLLS